MELNSKIYVAGHTGLVGSAIVNVLKNKGYTNIIGKTHKELDLTNQMAVRSFFEHTKPEYVFLAAAKVGGIMANNTYRAEFIHENLMIQNNIIHEAYRNQVKKLLFLGSTCIYPREAPQPMKEEYLLTSPLEYTNEPYAIAKIAGIKMCESYNLQYGTNFLSVMPTNLYGPNDNFDLEKSHVLPSLIRKIHLGKCLENNDWDAIRSDLNKRPIENVTGSATEKQILEMLIKYGVSYSGKSKVYVEIWGTGKPMREFLWSEEMADACVYFMENVDFIDLVKLSIKDKNLEIVEEYSTVEEFRNAKFKIRNTHVNIGTGKEISVKNLAELIRETIGYKGDFYFNTSKSDGTMRKLTDVSKLHNLGWIHRIEIEEGIGKLYNWYKNLLTV